MEEILTCFYILFHNMIFSVILDCAYRKGSTWQPVVADAVTDSAHRHFQVIASSAGIPTAAHLHQADS